METAPPVRPHPLVLKRANEWVAYAAQYDVKAVIESLDSSVYPGGLAVRFETNSHSERGCVLIYPPIRSGRKPRQSPVIMRYYRTRGRKVVFGHRPGTDLRDLNRHISQYWSPTWGERIKAEADRVAQRRAAGV